QPDRLRIARLRAARTFAGELGPDATTARLGAHAERPDRGPAVRPALDRRVCGVRVEPDRPDQPARALRHDQLRLAQTAAHIDDLADVALPRAGGQVSPEGAVDLGEEPRELIELFRVRIANAHIRE